MLSKDLQRTLTTFSGVFCPVSLAQFSSVIFLRLGFLVSQNGLLYLVLQIILAYSLLFLTVLSVCAISTNGAVSGGGLYFMLSRTLGPEMGGAIGILFYVSQIFSAALYIAAFTESINTNFGPDGILHPGTLPGSGGWWSYLYSSGVNFICFIILLFGSGFFARVSLIILLVVVSIILVVFASFFQNPFSVMIPRSNGIVYPDTNSTDVFFNFTGFDFITFRNNIFPSFTKEYVNESDVNFLVTFAVLVSGVTGIMNGANMSGDLKNPAKSIPKGTLWAIVFTSLTYTSLAFFSAFTCERNLMLNDYIYMQDICFWRPLVVIGIFCTTISAALGNLIGGSRVLEALARDDIFKVFWPAKWTTRSGNPLVAVSFTHILVQLALLIGSLNYIAPAVSVFFLLAYSFINFACMILDIASPANFRPFFRYFHWSFSLLGGIACILMSLLVQYLYTLVSVLLCVLIAFFLSKRKLKMGWGSILQALLFHQVRKYLLLLDDRKTHMKYWRPQVVLLISNPRSAASLVQFIDSMKKGGIYVLGHVLLYNESSERRNTLFTHSNRSFTIENNIINSANNLWSDYVEYLRVKAFVELTLSHKEDLVETLLHIVRLSGMGAMKPNTVCVGFYDDEPQGDSLTQIKTIRQKNGSWLEKDELLIHNLIQLEDFNASGNIEPNSYDGNLPLENHQTEFANKSFLLSNNPNHSMNRFQYIKLIESILLTNKNLLIARGFVNMFSDESENTLQKLAPTFSNTASNSSQVLNRNSCLEGDNVTSHGILHLTCSISNGSVIMSQPSKSNFSSTKMIISRLFKRNEQVINFSQLNEENLSNTQLEFNTGATFQFNCCINKKNSHNIDLWPIHPLKFLFDSRFDSAQLDLTGRFMLQMACLVGRSNQTRHGYLPYNLRVMIPIRLPTEFPSLYVRKTLESLVSQITELRINAEVHLVPFDDQEQVTRLNINYLLHFNQLIKSKCNDATAVCMMYLYTKSDYNIQNHEFDYLESLSILSKGLPATLFVHGLHEVNSIDL